MRAVSWQRDSQDADVDWSVISSPSYGLKYSVLTTAAWINRETDGPRGTTSTDCSGPQITQ